MKEGERKKANFKVANKGVRYGGYIYTRGLKRGKDIEMCA